MTSPPPTCGRRPGRQPGDLLPGGAPQASGGESLLFTTRTCPNCRQAEALLQKAGVPYQKVVAEESPDLTTRYGVRQAPTLVVQGESITGLGPIKRFAEEHRAREVG